MDFSFAEEEEHFRQELRDFLKKELPPDWRYGVIEASDEDASLEQEMRRKLAQRRWLALGWPKEYGGQGASPITQLVFNEEMAYHRAPGRDVFGIGMLGPTLMVHGTEEQQKKYLGDIARGEINWCQFFSEPGSGSDLASLQTRAVEDGDDFVINGQKIWSSGAHHADRFFMLARTDPDAPKHRGITFFLGDMKDPGIDVRPIVSMTGRHSFNEVFFDNVRVRKGDMVGEVNRGWYVAVTLLGFERSIIEYAAAARRALEELTRFAKEVRLNGTLLLDDPLVRHKVAEMAVEIEVARLLCYRVAWM
ncbi:MAG: acyl-CoA dehydrogenase family protein, partial [Dehalococcoidia bacterium]